MIGGTDLSKKESVLKQMQMKVKKPSGNYLSFKTRARSRSFEKLDDLLSVSDASSENIDEATLGVDDEGTEYKYSPKDTSIKKNYSEIKVLFQEVLSPTIVSLMTSTLDGKVSPIIKPLKVIIFSGKTLIFDSLI